MKSQIFKMLLRTLKFGIIAICILSSFTSFAQYLGSDIKIEQVQANQPDYIITIEKYQNVDLLLIEDSIRVYFGHINSIPFSLTASKIGQSILYGNVYKVTYQYQGIVQSFNNSTKVYFRTQDSLMSNEIINLSNNGLRAANTFAWQQNAGGFWGDFDTPIFQNNLYEFYQSGNFLRHDVSCNVPSLVDSVYYDLIPIDSTHTYPLGVSIDNFTGVVSIDSTLSGKYLFNVSVRTWYYSAERTTHNRIMLVDIENVKTQLATNTKSIQLPKFTLKIHPNPTSESLQINTETPVDEIQIYNSIGQQVWQGQGFRENQVRVNIRDFSDGMYIVRVRQGESWVSEQVLVSR